MGAGAWIGHGSLINCNRLMMAGQAGIGHFSRIHGSIDIELEDHAVIGHRNTIVRGRSNLPPSKLRLGKLSKITSNHRLDLTRDIRMGDYSTIAGMGCQLWTHGYVHARDGAERYRVDGSIMIGSSVYVGSMSFISMGVTIGDGVIIGGGSSIGSDLLEAGLYVSAPIRHLPRPAPPQDRADLVLSSPDGTGDIVYIKNQSHQDSKASSDHS
jgi:acetyltransferase-like isoleucine patch superfamily enzyme